MAEHLSELRQFITGRVREGFESAHEIVENASQWAYEKCGRDDFLPEIKRLTTEALAAHRAEQAGWGPTTDCDRLDAAFAALNANGIVARQDFSCCNNCGFKEIWDEVEDAEKTQTVDGYVFYHLQCTEQAIKTGRLFMAYGSVEEGREAFLKVGRQIVEALTNAGLEASWGGTEYDPIVVENITWRRRR